MTKSIAIYVFFVLKRQHNNIAFTKTCKSEQYEQIKETKYLFYKFYCFIIML